MDGWSGLWLRIGGYKNEELGFDNMGDRPIKGSSGWAKCEIIMDVPENAATLNFGALLAGGGKIWFDAIAFEVVDQSAEPTAKAKIPAFPVNTNFED